MDVLLLGQVLRGVSGAGILPMTQIVLCDIVPLRFRPKYASVAQLAWAIGLINSPLIGGLMVRHVTWRWIFYMNLPFCGVGMVIVPFIIRLKTKQSSTMAKLTRIDWIGEFLFIGCMTSFLMAITWGGVDHAWDSEATLVAPLVIGIVKTIVSILWEKWGAREPFIRLAIFSNWSAHAGYYCAMTQGLVVRLHSLSNLERETLIEAPLLSALHSVILHLVISHLGQRILSSPYRRRYNLHEQYPRSNRSHCLVAHLPYGPNSMGPMVWLGVSNPRIGPINLAGWYNCNLALGPHSNDMWLRTWRTLTSTHIRTSDHGQGYRRVIRSDNIQFL
jgi:hypothetical protein